MANEKMTDWNVTLDQFVGLVREEMLKSVDNTSIFFRRPFHLTRWVRLS